MQGIAGPRRLALFAALLLAGCCQGWCQEDAGIGADVRAVHGAAPDDVWMSAADGSALHWDGRSFRNFKGPAPAMGALWATGAGQLWGAVVGSGYVHYDGAAWRVTASRLSFVDVAATEGGEVFALNGSGTLCRLTTDGSGGEECAQLAPVQTLSALWAGTRGRVLVAGSGGFVFVRGGGAWSIRDLNASSTVLKVVGDEVFWALLADGSVARLDPDPRRDTRWPGVIPAGETPVDLYATGPDEAWALSLTKLRHCKGDRWETVKLPLDKGLTAIWGASPDDLWVVGREGKVLHYLKER